MITFLEGVLMIKFPTRAVLNVGGVGYEVFISLNSYEKLPETQNNCHLLIYDYIREDQHTLFGFMEEGEKEVFTKLLNVTGIGPKLALSALSKLSAREIITSVATGNVERLNSISGIGKKIAERMIVELREQFAGLANADSNGAFSKAFPDDMIFRDAVQALVSLGYKTTEAQKRVSVVRAESKNEMSVEELVRKSLNR